MPDRMLALRYWVFELEPAGPRSCRLHARTYAGDPPAPIEPLMLAAFEPSHFAMERATLLGIKSRAERSARR